MNKQQLTVCFSLCLLFAGCKPKLSPNEQMVERLREQARFANNPANAYAPAAVLKHIDSLIKAAHIGTNVVTLNINKSTTLLQLGEEQKAVSLMDSMLNKVFIPDYLIKQNVIKVLALAYLRLGERTNCIHNHSAESCIFPIAGKGIHADKNGSEKAIELYKKLLKTDPSDYESKWLINIAYMTTGGYPDQVPPELLIKNTATSNPMGIKPFKEVAMNLGLAVKKISGGSIVDDFDNDGYNDIVTSSASLAEPMHYFHNNKDGSFTDWGKSSGLSSFTGGLNMMQTDYNNDGLKDIFVVRGGWKGKFGKEPNSLLKNNGNGTFTDVTEQSGLLSLHPTQTATWADFNNDGWLDVFIGNENAPGDENASELYINNKNGTFTEQSAGAGCHIKLFVKGVTSGDYNNDGLPDLYVSTMDGRNILFKNLSAKNGKVKFKDVTVEAGMPKLGQATFTTWFFDYDNDGNLDLLACGYGNDTPIASIAGAEAVDHYLGNNGKVVLYHNLGNGKFENTSVKAGLTKVAFTMGANFGDIDNDGYPDFYLGTGNPQFSSLIPNKLYKNNNGRAFTDVTTPARVGSLQKGHGVSFADLDNDGYQDIHMSLGGAYIGDSYQNALFINPVAAKNNWIDISLAGTKSNRAAIGTKLKVTFTENGKQRTVYREVNSGGSFGSSPLQQHIGIGKATVIDEVQVQWPVTGKKQIFKNLATAKYYRIKEGTNTLTTFKLKQFDFEKGQLQGMEHMNM
jgi:hypothetical protein